MKNNKGITLVSLIGYIILSLMVLSILIMVTSNFRRNFGELNVQTVHEVEFDKINLQISKEIREGNRINREKTTESKLTFKDNKTYSFVLADKAIYLNDNIKIAEHIENCKFEIVGEQTLKLTARIEGKERTIEYAIGLYIDRSYINVGDYVDYTPDTATAVYTGLGASTNENANPSGSAENLVDGIQQDTDLKWRVMTIKEDGTIDLVADEPIDTNVHLKNALGFNNGVLLLNDLCKKHYSNTTLKANGRSINLIDIENSMNDTGVEARNAYKTATSVEYGTSGTYTGNIQVPDIYKHASKTIAGESSDYYKTATTLTTTKESSLEARSTYYNLVNQASYYNSTEFYNLIFGGTKNYWLASRYAYCETNNVSFGIRCVSGNTITGNNLISFDGTGDTYHYFVRPVVTLNADVKISQTGGTLETPRTLSK